MGGKRGRGWPPGAFSDLPHRLQCSAWEVNPAMEVSTDGLLMERRDRSVSKVTCSPGRDE